MNYLPPSPAREKRPRGNFLFLRWSKSPAVQNLQL
jgi:hypothetical protein